MNRSRRSTVRLDYFRFNKTGEKVEKSDCLPSVTMSDAEKLRLEERRCLAEINEIIELNDLDDFDELDLISDHINDLMTMLRRYRDIHYRIEDEIGVEAYKEQYPLFEKNLDNIKNEIKHAKSAKARIKDADRLKTEKKEGKNAQAKLEDEIDLCLCKVDSILVSFPVDRLSLVEDIRLNVGKMSENVATYNYLVSKLSNLISADELPYAKKLEKATEYIENGKAQIDSILNKMHESEKESEKSKLTDISEKELTSLQRLLDEITFIEDNLTKLKHIDVSLLKDEDLLYAQKELKNKYSKCDSLSEKISMLYSKMPVDFENRKERLDDHSKKEGQIHEILDLYRDKLKKEIVNRNVNKENLSGNTSLKIILKKFSGFDAALDIYSFQTEFEKLVEPGMPTKLLPDCLKNNYLDGSALTLVKGLDSMDDIWNRLKNAYGDTETLLNNKLKEVENLGPMWKCRDKSKKVQTLSKLVFVMTDVQDLAIKHEMENDLYHGVGLQRVYDVIGHAYRDKFIRNNTEVTLSKKDKWVKLINFLKLELRVQEEILLVEKGSGYKSKPENTEKETVRKSYSSSEISGKSMKCHLCGKSDHVLTTDFFGKQVVQYFSCKVFVDMAPKQRFKLLQDKGLCYQCLSPGATIEHGKHRSGSCFSKFACKHRAHSRYPRKKHVLLCEEHKSDAENLNLLEKYKSENILKFDTLKDFSKQIKLSFHSSNTSFVSQACVEENEISDSAIYVLQTVLVEGEELNMFFDSGCGDLVCSKTGISKLEQKSRANLIVPGPIQLGGVGDITTISQHGVYKVNLSLWNGESICMRGVCLDQVTCKFPKYPLEKVEKDIRDSYRLAGNDPNNLPRLPEYVGGETHLMLGIKYFKYFPEFIFQLPTGLTIYRSQFCSPDGSRGVIGGPHEVFTDIERQMGKSFMSLGTYFSQQMVLFKLGCSVNPDLKLLSGVNQNFGDIELQSCSEVTNYYPCKTSVKAGRLFEEVEKAGSEITYRCVNCRNCAQCKKSEEIQYISIQEEIEQDIIDNSVHVDVQKGFTIAKLPFIMDPMSTLVTNKSTALSVYKSQVRKLDRNPKDREDVIESERKMQKLGFVDSLENLTQDQRETIDKSPIHYYIPWRAVWNTNSLSTPCRLVFDASQITPSGNSLNSTLAKGRNNMNKLVEILIRWLIHRFAFHTDVRKMYNTVKLDQQFWNYQLYLWHDQLSVSHDPIVKVIKTLIYGVRSSGNQAESGLRKTAVIESKNYPEASKIIIKDTYVDDCLSGTCTEKERTKITDEIQLVLARGGFTVKGYIFSGRDPPAEFSTDGVSVKVAGMKWYPKEDKISLVSGDLNFSKKKRGKKDRNRIGIPDDFTRRDCVKKVSEMFDLVGKVTPITCALKLDLRTLVNRKLDWDDKIPSDLKAIWIANFQTLQDLTDVKFSRTVIPDDAANLQIDTIDLGDASNLLVCSAIYARILRKNGSYSCQLIFSRSKLVPEGMSIPRAELYAAHLNATIGHVVKLSLGDYHRESVKLIDSQVSLFWISNTKNPLKQWVRNKVVDITRLTDRSSWMYIRSEDNIADMGTRKGATIPDVSSESRWICGSEWMRGNRKDFPAVNVNDIRLKKAEVEAIKKESLRPELVNTFFTQSKDMPSTYVASVSSSKKIDINIIAERYEFSDYIIDPNKFRLRKVVRVLALVIIFVRNFVKKWSKGTKTVLKSSDREIGTFSENILKYFNTDKYVVSCGIVYAATNSAGDVSLISCQPGLVVCLSEEDIGLSLSYFYRKCTSEIKQFTDRKSYGKISEEKLEILYYTGRILPSQEFGGTLKLSDVMLDLTSSTFNVPIVDRFSPFAFAIVNEIHWYHPVAKHSGNETVWRYTLKYAYIIDGKELVRSIRKDCTRCRYLAKRTVDVVMGPVSKVNLMLAPAFYVSQIDLFGPVKSFSVHNKRSTVSIWFLIFCCCTTGAVSLKVMEDYSTSAFILGFIRFSCSVGYPKMLLPDEGSQLVRGCKQMQLRFTDIRQRLHVEYGVEFESCPVGGHNMHGKVERKIQHVKQAMNKELNKERLSVLQWETIGDQIANCVNDTPLAVRYVPRDVEQVDLLTPNRLMLGRNNDRSPSGPLRLSSNLEKNIEQNERIMIAWFECWLISHVPKLIDKPKWFNSDTSVSVGDVVLFLKKDKEYAGNYQYGIIKDIEISRDEKTRKVIVEYINSNETVRRETRRSVRELVVIHPVDELGIVRELGEAATWVDMKRKMNSTCIS